jgi:hypothetical protein
MCRFISLFAFDEFVTHTRAYLPNDNSALHSLGHDIHLVAAAGCLHQRFVDYLTSGTKNAIRFYCSNYMEGSLATPPRTQRFDLLTLLLAVGW